MGEDVIRIEIVLPPIEITCYESIDTVALKRRGRKLRPKGRKRKESGGEGTSLSTSDFLDDLVDGLADDLADDRVGDLVVPKSERRSQRTVILVMEYLNLATTGTA
jgi:hypothetical protein